MGSWFSCKSCLPKSNIGQYIEKGLENNIDIRVAMQQIGE